MPVDRDVREVRGRRRAGGRPTVAAVFGGYLALALLALAPRVVAHPTTRHVGGLFTDPQIFVWSFAWWPHAILHGENPFYTHAIWAPDGFNLAWATSVPALAVAFAPLTLAFGPIFAYNVASVLMPALAATAAFLLCRRLTGALWPSLVGGYLFGFSSYVLGGELSHVNTVSVFLVPIVALLVLDRLDGRISAARTTIVLGVVLALQLFVWTELAFTLTVALACSLLLAYVLVPDARSRIVRLLVPLAGAYGLAALLASPLLYYVVTGTDSSPTQVSQNFVADAANLVVPTRATVGGWWGERISAHFPANEVESGSYLGVPTLLIVAWFALRRWRTPGGRFLVAGLVLAIVAAFGSWLTVDGRRVVTLPWARVADAPFFEHVMPARLAMFASLAAAVIVASWAASDLARLRVRVALSALAVAAVLPNVSWVAWARTPDVPALFTSGGYRDCLARGENILPLPVGPSGDSMVWQAESGFWFRMAGAYISPKIPVTFAEPPSVLHLTSGDHPAEVTPAAIRLLARRKGITSIVVDARRARDWRPVLRPFGPPAAAGGALVYRLQGAAPPAGGCANR